MTQTFPSLLPSSASNGRPAADFTASLSRPVNLSTPHFPFLYTSGRALWPGCAFRSRVPTLVQQFFSPFLRTQQNSNYIHWHLRVQGYHHPRRSQGGTVHILHAKELPFGPVLFDKLTDFVAMISTFSLLESLSCAIAFQVANPPQGVSFAAPLRHLDYPRHR